MTRELLTRMQQTCCGLLGHDTLLQFTPDRLFLKCTTCGHESPGWDLNETPPTDLRPETRLHIVRRVA